MHCTTSVCVNISSRQHTLIGITIFITMASPPDGGYGWVILAIACYQSSSLGTLDFGFSVILGPFAQHFHTSTTILSLGGEMIGVIQYLLAPLFAHLGQHFGYRKTLIVACTVVPLSIASSGFVQDAYSFVVLFCLVTGLCFGQMLLSTVMILDTYFDKKLVLAHGFFTAAMTMGATLPSVVINFLAIDYGLTHVSMFLASMFLVCLLMMPFFYPFAPDPLMEERSKQTTSKIRDWKTYCNFHGILFYGSVTLFYFGFMMSYMYLVEIVEYQSAEVITTTQRSLVVLTFSLVNAPAKVIVSLATNYFDIAPQLVASTGLFLNCAVLTSLAYVNSFYIQVALIALFGIFNAPTSAFTVPTAIKLFGKDNSDKAIGILYVCVGLGCIPGAPLTGLIFDQTETYMYGLFGSALLYLLAGSCNIVSCYFFYHGRFKDKG